MPSGVTAILQTSRAGLRRQPGAAAAGAKVVLLIKKTRKTFAKNDFVRPKTSFLTDFSQRTANLGFLKAKCEHFLNFKSFF